MGRGGSKQGRRYPRHPCPKCGLGVGSNNMDRHVRSCPDEPLAQEARRQKREARADRERQALINFRFTQYARSCNTFASTHPNLRDLGDITAPGDPYDLQESMRAAFERGVLPERFVADAFAEDIARSEGEAAEYAESLAHEAESLTHEAGNEETE